MHNESTPDSTRPYLYYISSIVIFSLAILYCAVVYFTGSIKDTDYGYQFLLGIPNYYLFYLTIFPFVTAGIVYLATHNMNIRFFGSLNPVLAPDKKRRILKLRKVFLFAAVLISVAVVISDAAEKDRALPPYSLDLKSEHETQSAIQKYFEFKEAAIREDLKYQEVILQDEKNAVTLMNNLISTKLALEENYFHELKKLGFGGDSVSGFTTLSSWFSDSSFAYKFESFLSWIAALVISLFFVQLFLIIIVKEYVRPETKNLVLWLLILCSFWIPTKIFSVYYYSIAMYEPPSVVWFAIILLAISIVLALFIRVEKNDMSKYATAVGALFSLAGTLVSVFVPEYFELAIKIVSDLGWVFGSIILIILALSIYLVTDNMIHSYETSNLHAKDSVADNSSDNAVKPV